MKRFCFPLEPLKASGDRPSAAPTSPPTSQLASFWDSHSGDARLQRSLPGPVVILRTGADDREGPTCGAEARLRVGWGRRPKPPGAPPHPHRCRTGQGRTASVPRDPPNQTGPGCGSEVTQVPPWDGHCSPSQPPPHQCTPVSSGGSFQNQQPQLPGLRRSRGRGPSPRPRGPAGGAWVGTPGRPLGVHSCTAWRSAQGLPAGGERLLGWRERPGSAAKTPGPGQTETWLGSRPRPESWTVGVGAPANPRNT